MLMKNVILVGLVLTILQISVDATSCIQNLVAPQLCKVPGFITLSDGNISRAYDHFAGELKESHCRAYCGCNGYTYAAVDDQSFCWCGNTLGADCGSETYCLTVLTAENVFSKIGSAYPTTGKLFEPVEIPVESVSYISEVGLVEDGKLSMHDPSSVQKVLTKINTTLRAEVEAFWGCQSEPITIQAHLDQSIELECPKGVALSSTFYCYAHINGTRLNALKFSIDGKLVTEHANVAETTLYSFGGNMETNRFEEYWESFKWADNIYTGFININHVIEVEGFIKAFEAYVTRTGCIQFLIVKPVCTNPDHKYCNYQRQCLPKTDPTECGDDPDDFATFYAPPGLPVFCMDKMRYTNEGNYTAPPIEVADTIWADYKVEYEFTVNATGLGDQVFVVPDNETFYVKYGYVLGWVACGDFEQPGDVGYYPIDPVYEDMYRRYRYPEVAKAVKGSFFTPDLEDSIVENYREMVQAIVMSPVIYEEEITAAGADGDIIQVEVTLEYNDGESIAKTASVMQMEQITSFRLKASSYDITANSLWDLGSEIEVDSGEASMSYCVDFGDSPDSNTVIDDCKLTCSDKALVNHTYALPGEYTVYVKVFNLFSYNSTTIQVIVRGTIESIEFLEPSNPVQPIPVNETLTFCAVIKGSGATNLQLDVYNDKVDQMTENNTIIIDIASLFLVCVEKIINEPSDQLCFVGVTDPLNLKNISDYGKVENPVEPFNFTMEQMFFAETNLLHNFNLTNNTGTNVTFYWDLDSTTLNMSSGILDDYEMSHTYNRYGLVNITILGKNLISNHTEIIQIFVQDKIDGVEFSSTDTFHTEFEKMTSIYAHIKTGTAMVVHFEFVDTEDNTIVTPELQDIDTLSTQYVYTEITLTNAREYNVTIFVKNSISSMNVTTSFWVEKPVQNLTASFIQEFSGTEKLDYIEENETLLVTAEVLQGDNVFYTYSFGDGRPNITVPEHFYNFSYPKWSESGESYILRVTAKNRISEMTTSIEVYVEMPVQRIEGLSLLTAAASAVTETPITLTSDSGDYFNCTFDFHNDKPTKRHDWNDLEKNEFTIMHLFGAGKHSVTVNCSNRLYESNVTVEMDAYEPCNSFSAEAFSVCEGEPPREGLGDRSDLYACSCNVTFKVPDQEGTNASNHYYFGYNYDNGTKVTAIEWPINNFTHKFPCPEPVNERKIVITCENPVTLEKVKQRVKIKLIETVEPFTISTGSTNEHLLGYTSNFSITLTNAPYQCCCTLDLGNPSEDNPLGDKLLFGSVECQSKSQFASGYQYLEKDADGNIVEFDGTKTILLYKHLYLEEKLYDISVSCENELIKRTVEEKVKVIDLPCNMPNVSWSSAIGDSTIEAINYKKCMKATFEAKVTRDCQKRDTEIWREWTLEKVLDSNGDPTTDEFVDLDLLPSDTLYKKDVRELEYGTYRLSLTAFMMIKTNTTEKEVPQTRNTIHGYFNITHCKLVAKFKGGNGQAVGQKNNFTIDASESLDPDMDPTEIEKMSLEYEWYCKQKNESANLNNYTKIFVTYRKPKHSATILNKTAFQQWKEAGNQFSGCFGTGIGRLFGDGLSGKAITLQLPYTVADSDYVIMMCLSQMGRENDRPCIFYDLQVTSKDVPLVEIKCTSNCGSKVDPTSSLKLVANCMNCDSVNTDDMVYSWKVLEMPDEIDVTDRVRPLMATDIDKDKNFVSLPHAFTPGSKTKLLLEVLWKEGDSVKGFTSKNIKVNEPPYIPPNGEFKIEPSSGGKAGQTKFVISAEGITDIDTPLKFYFYTRDKTKGEEWTLMGYKQGEAKSEPSFMSAGTIEVKIVAEDVFKVKSETRKISTTVEEFSLSADAVLNMINSPTLSDPATIGNTFSVILDSIQNNPAYSDEEVAEMKSKMLAKIRNTPITSPDSASILLGTIDKALDADKPMPAEDVENVLGTFENIMNIPKGDYSPSDFFKVVKQIMTTTSKVTKSSVSKSKTQQSDEYMHRIGNVQGHFLALLAEDMIPGEHPYTIYHFDGETQVQCLPLEATNDTQSFNAFNIDPQCAKEAVEKARSLAYESNDEGYEENTKGCLGSVQTSGRNTFSYDEPGSANIHGLTHALEIYRVGNRLLDVSNCSKKMTFIVENPFDVPEWKTYEAYYEITRIIHELDTGYNQSCLFIYVKPEDEKFDGRFFIFLNKDFLPSLVSNDANCTLPNPYPENYNNQTEDFKKEFESNRRWRCMIKQSTIGQMALGKWLYGVIWHPKNESVENITMLGRDTPAPLSKYHSVNYTLRAFVRSCQYRNTTSNKWMSNEGIDEPGEDTNETHTVCETNHLTMFGGGGPFATANPIDFAEAFKGFANVGDNPTVFAIVLSLFALYLILLIWARRTDLKDLVKMQVCELEDNHPNDSYFYEVSLQTGFYSGASTTADVFIILGGSEGETPPRHLKNPERKCFQRNDTDAFLVSSPINLGSVTEVQVWHNNTGLSPGWYLMQIQVLDLQTMRKAQFICNDWLDVAESDGHIRRRIRKAKKEDLMEFDYVFYQTARRNLYDGHIWLSIFTRPAQSTFTRVQRLTTVLSLLMMTLLANAMFYTGGDVPEPDAIKIGPLWINWRQVKIGFTSALIVVPANLLIIILFKKAGPKVNKNAEKYSEQKSDNSSVSPSTIELEQDLKSKTKEEIKEEEETEAYNNLLRFIRSICFAGRADEEDGKKNKPLPHWLIYIAYLLCFLTSVASAFFVILYGFQFGKMKSDQWVVSMLVSFGQSIFILQPLKVLILSVIFAVMFKEPPKVEEMYEVQRQVIHRKGVNDDVVDDPAVQMSKRNMYRLPQESRLDDSRSKRFREKRIKIIIREILVHTSFVILCVLVVYASVDPNSQRLYQSAFNLVAYNGITNEYFDGKTYDRADFDPDGNPKDVKDATSISMRAEWFEWARYSVIEYLFPKGWYNHEDLPEGKKFTFPKGMIADSATSRLLAMARFRQLRVKLDSCTKHPVFVHLIVDCNGAYSIQDQDSKDYNFGWKPYNKTENEILGKGERPVIHRGNIDPWLYSSMAKLQNFPFFGRFATYDGASYAVSIGPRKKIANRLLYRMKDYFWIDRQTRAVFTEANVFNANANLMLLITFVHEIIPTGGWNFYPNVQPIKLYRYIGGMGEITVFLDIAFMLVTFYGVYRIAKNVKRKGCGKYLSNLWNLLHFIVTFCSLCAFAMTIFKMLQIKYKLRDYRKNPEEFVSFSLIAISENITIAFLGFILFFTNLEFLRILRFNQQIALMSKTMSQLGSPLASFGLTFVVIFMAYSSLSHCLFVDKLEDFRTFMETIKSLSRMFMGQFSITDYFDNAPRLGPILFFTYMISVQMVMLNLFVGLICDAFGGDDDEEEKPDFFAFMKSQVKNIQNKGGNGIDPVYMDWKDEWDVMMEAFEDRCDNCVYIMRNMESEEARQTKFFREGDKDEKKKNVLAAVVGMEYFLYDSEFCDGLQAIENKLKEMSFKDSEELLQNAAVKKLESNARPQTEMSMGSDNEDDFDENDEEGSGDETAR